MTNPDLRKLPPQSLEAEMSVLGGILIDNDAINRVLEILGAEDFYRESHRKIFQAMMRLSDQREPCDLITMTDMLKKQGELEEVGGAPYLLTLVDYVPTAANIAYYCKIVKEKAVNRKLISVATEIVTRGYDEQADINELLDLAQKNIYEISENKLRPQYVPVQAVLKEAFTILKTLHDRKEHVTGVPTGYVDLDHMTAGFQPGDLIIVAARPSMGKTTLALNVAEYASADPHNKKKVPSVIFSLEMGKEQLVMRFLASIAKVDFGRMRTGHFLDSDWPRLTRAAGILHDAKIFIDDTPAISVLELRSKARRLKSEHDIGLIIIDYLQLMRGGANPESRQQEISEISRSLKALAKELNVPVIALSQLNRELEKRADKRPMMSDLRESGAIEQDADVIMFVYRESVYCEQCRKRDGTCTQNHERNSEIIIGKQRNGAIGTVNLAFFGEHTRFENLSAREG
ncbi:replicative DNA helicase [Pelobacter propionicus]|uniref:Replicative DNA helicase n=1 Tax=Pelobacter propionicus (strain DSM 2379 / NBRC 103807 / OttBd1) TaxID=338966 RepID=A1ALE5_PELPD|nr:replicative DNA helicase [Pelobacter propionicus]ABK98165.1 primary replicative DNA helicase [Pelobacter propionicus DSM 2379]